MSTIETKRINDQTPAIALIILAIIGVGGLGWAWGSQMIRGMEITGLNQQVVWGLYIAGFFVAMGIGSTLVVLAAASEFTSQVSTELRKPLLMTALASFLVGGILIGMDVGNPINIWRIITAGRLTSMMTWDFWALIVVGFLTLLYLFVCWGKTASSVLTKGISILAMISAIMLVVVEGWMLGILTARPLWHGSITVLNFIVSAAIAGVAVAMLIWPDILRNFSRWLKIGLLVSLVILLVDVSTIWVGESIPPQDEVMISVSGSLSPIFWLLVIGGLLIPILMLWETQRAGWLRVAAILALMGVFLEKIWILSAGQTIPWLDIPAEAYKSTWVEWVGIVGSVAFASFFYLLIKWKGTPAKSD